jgi:uncharacterized protein involved in exopolysaccharide biosynthesis
MFAIIAKYRAFVTRFVIGVTLLVTIVTFLSPKWYKSSASVFPAERADLFGGIEGLSSLARSISSPARALSSLAGSPELDRYVAILKSWTVLSAVIEKFDLVNVYEITSYPMEKTTKELLSNVEFTVELEGNLTITVYDKDPQRAAEMANFFVEMLNKTNTELMVQNARGNRNFIEQRYDKNLRDLAAAEDTLKAFQQRYGVIALPEQMEASIKAAAEMVGALAFKEVQAGVLRRTLSKDNPAVRAAEIEISEYRKKLGEMGRGDGSSSGDMKVFVPFKQAPELGAEYIRRYREVEIQYKILQFITPLYEQAKVEERRQTPSVLVLDKAIPAERKSKPKVALYSLLALFSSLLVAIAGVFMRESVLRVRETHPDRYQAIVNAFRSDWMGLRPRKRRR